MTLLPEIETLYGNMSGISGRDFVCWGFQQDERRAMAATNRAQSAQQKLEQHLLGAVNDALDLVRRFQELEGFRAYLLGRLPLIVPIGLLIVVTSIACAAATVLYLGGTRSFLVLLAMLLVPFVLAGSLFVQAYTFFSWLESRALAQALHRKAPRGPMAAWMIRKLGVDMGSLPSVPWVLAAIFLLLPLAMLVMVAPTFGLALIVLLVLAPVVFARFDRR
jgi:hypothetical protein